MFREGLIQHLNDPAASACWYRNSMSTTQWFILFFRFGSRRVSHCVRSFIILWWKFHSAELNTTNCVAFDCDDDVECAEKSNCSNTNWLTQSNKEYEQHKWQSVRNGLFVTQTSTRFRTGYNSPANTSSRSIASDTWMSKITRLSLDNRLRCDQLRLLFEKSSALTHHHGGFTCECFVDFLESDKMASTIYGKYIFCAAIKFIISPDGHKSKHIGIFIALHGTINPFPLVWFGSKSFGVIPFRNRIINESPR